MAKGKSTMKFRNCICLAFLLGATVQAFPADTKSSRNHQPGIRAFTPDSKLPLRTLRSATHNASKQGPRFNASSLMTTSSLLFKDTKPILTYLLGQPKKQGSLSSPAHLLSPDRYEFFTFDDDGQIVKKLMSVKEIQKIIANTEKAFTGEHGTPIEYYQILSVTPDVESIPSVSRINPNEPLFSIHDVIASVQNVLKSEINFKQSQLKSDSGDSGPGSQHYEILTEKPDGSYLGSNQKVSSSVASESVFLKKVQTSSPEPNKDIQDPTTRRVDQQDVDSVSQREGGTEFRQGVQTVDFLSSKTKDLDKLSPSGQAQDGLTFTKTSKTSTTTSVPMPTFVVMQEETRTPGSGDTTTVKTVIVPVRTDETSPLSLLDAHPAIISNDTWPLDMEPFTFTQNWRIEEADAEEPSPNSGQGSGETTSKLETLLTDSKTQTEAQDSGIQAPETETATSGEQISITPDLANSVSSVLWQIVSENALLDNASKSTQLPPLETDKGDISESFETSETKGPGQKDGTSQLSIDSTSTQHSETQDRTEENPFTVLETILRTQAKPTSIRPLSSSESATGDTKSEEFSTASSAPDSNLQLTSSSANEESSTETKETESTSESEEVTSQESQDQTTQKSADSSEKVHSTTVSPTVEVTLTSDSAFENPEQVKSTTEKTPTSITDQTLGKKESEETVDVRVSSEDTAGPIPKTTELPEQSAKDSQKAEPESSTEDSSADSDGETVTLTTTPSEAVTESTTLTENIDTKEEEYTESSESPQQSTVSGSTEQTDQHQDTSSEGVDIAFVPMVIKSSSQTKNETDVSEGKEDKLEVRQQEEVSSPEVGSSTAFTTEGKDDDLESKKLPDGESDLPASQPVTTSTTTTTTTIKDKTKVSSEASSTNIEEVASLKHNIPTKYQSSGKPQSSGLTKPTKGKPQGDAKPSKPLSSSKPGVKEPSKGTESKKPYENHVQSSPSLLELEAAPPENLGLEKTVANLDEDIKRFSELCNELAFSLWSSITHNGLSFVRSLVVSPFAVTSLLAMVFLGARGPTSGQMNDVLKLDDMVTFNPHLVFRNVTESLIIFRNPGVATAAFVRELYSDKSKGKLLDFYKERAQQFYDGHVEEINFKTVGDTIRRQTNHLVKRQTWGKMTDFMRTSNLIPKPPLAAFGANIFQTDCSKASIKDRDGEMYFVILPASRLRRLMPIPAAVWRSDFLAGYEPQLDATAVSIGSPNAVVSTIYVLPGQQGLIAPGDTLARLEHHLLGSPYRKGHWTRLMKSLLPRPGLELQIPRLSHKSVVNVTSSLQRMGLKDLFSADKADLTGLNGLANDLHLSDMLQVNLFSTCGEEPVGARHHSEVYPATPILKREKSYDGVSSDSIDNLFAVSDFENPAISALPLELRPRQARLPLSKPGVKIPEPPRLRFDRPFLFFVRHNPTGLILHMGRFNPRLTP